jgi:hypothetical protein
MYPNGSVYTNFSDYLDIVSVGNISKFVASVAMLGEEDVADTVLSFVQNVGYNSTSYSMSYTLYPVETLAEGGVCDDLSVLYASMMMSLGFKVIFILYPHVADLGVSGTTVRHLNVGVHLNGPPQHPLNGESYHYFTYDGLEYYVAETAGVGWRVGDLPPDVTGQSDYVENAAVSPGLAYQTTSSQTTALSPTFGGGSYIWPTSVVAGGTITAYFYITNPNSYSIQVNIGMSIRQVGTDNEIVDTGNDIIVTLSAGTNVYTRVFTVPTIASPGSYEWLLAISSVTPGQLYEYANTDWQGGLIVS